jgi:2-amino-4-hydroxy-6-hydroxymethyldihydropteridine diphosphokinase
MPDLFARVLSFRASSLYLSSPIDADGPNYINAVAQFNSLSSGPDILQALQAIEKDFGRARSHRNAPRTLDLDLLLYGDQLLNLPDLIVPHPRLTQRAFVLKPLAELNSTLLIHGRSVGEYLEQCADQQCELLDEQ